MTEMNSNELEKTLMEICYEKRGVLTGAAGQGRCVAVLWFVQVDAAVGVEPVDEVDSGGAQARVVLREIRPR